MPMGGGGVHSATNMGGASRRMARAAVTPMATSANAISACTSVDAVIATIGLRVETPVSTSFSVSVSTLVSIRVSTRRSTLCAAF